MRFREFAERTGPGGNELPGVYLLDPNTATRRSQIIKITNMSSNAHFMKMWNTVPESFHALFKNVYPIWDQKNPLFSSLPIVEMTWGEYFVSVSRTVNREQNPEKFRSRQLKEKNKS